jgi:hypothetical protein
LIRITWIGYFTQVKLIRLLTPRDRFLSDRLIPNYFSESSRN